MILSKKYSIGVVAITIMLYFFMGYFIDRTHFYSLLFCWCALFFTSYTLYNCNKEDNNFLIGIAILFRIVFIFATPNLSQDFYRFIWDGRMLFEGYNPYLSLPKKLIEQNILPIHQAAELYQGMGPLNGSHYTNYPPINQLCFYLAAVFSNSSILGAVVILRLQIIAADIGVFIFGKKLLQKLQLPTHHIFLYLLNPFVIIELTGNLHFEPVMLFFLIAGFYYLHQQKWIVSGILIACSVAVKLIPLLFLPLFYQFFVKKETSIFKGIKHLLLFYLVIFVTLLLLFFPFITVDFINNYTNSVGLWFKNFEFNASIYYIAREIGYLFRGYNEIAIIGKIMPLVTIFCLLFFSFFKNLKNTQQLLTGMLLCLSVYYFTTTTMHPWYLASLIILAVFTKYRFPIVWSLAVILSYQAYANTPWKENLWFVFFEYLIVYWFFIKENIPYLKSLKER